MRRTSHLVALRVVVALEPTAMRWRVAVRLAVRPPVGPMAMRWRVAVRLAVRPAVEPTAMRQQEVARLAVRLAVGPTVTRWPAVHRAAVQAPEPHQTDWPQEAVALAARPALRVGPTVKAIRCRPERRRRRSALVRVVEVHRSHLQSRRTARAAAAQAHRSRRTARAAVAQARDNLRRVDLEERTHPRPREQAVAEQAPPRDVHLRSRWACRTCCTRRRRRCTSTRNWDRA